MPAEGEIVRLPRQAVGIRARPLTCNEGILVRRSYTESPPRVEYELTGKGRELGNALQRLAQWGRSYMTDPLL